MVDDFEAALAAADSTPAVEEVIEPTAQTAVDVVDQVEEEVEENDENAEFRKALRNAPGDWYVIHSYAGFEKRVKANLQNRITSLNMEDYIYQIEVPEEEFNEIKNGQRKVVKRNVYPGYVLVRMDLTDASWGTVRHTPGVTGFVGHGHQPAPLTLDEVVNILAPTPEAKPGAPAARCRPQYPPRSPESPTW